MSDLPDTIAELQSSIAKGDLSPQEAVQIQCAKLSGYECERDGFVDVFDIPNDEIPHSGPLKGVGLAHKDIFQLTHRQAGLGLTKKGLPANSSAQSAECVEALHRSGAVQLGALHMAAYACGATSQNEVIGECLNPLDGKTVVGGSSSGSAVAVARGLCYASLGTDTAGSIRMPAASCGLVGLKTTQGLLSTVGVAPLAPQLDSVGIVARSALDLEMVLREIVGHNTSQVAAQGFTLKAPRELSQIHCWLPSASMDDGVAQEVLECMKKLPNTSIDEQFSDEASLSASAELMLYHQAALTHRSKLLPSSSNPMESSMGTVTGLTPLPQGLVEMVRLGLVAPVSWAKEVLAQRSVWRQRFETQFFQSHDLMVVPCIGIELPLASQVRVGSIDFDARKLLQLHRFMGWVNYLGLPSLSLPIGKDSKGMPISIQVLCRPYEELSLLHWAQHFIGSRLGTQNVRQHFPFFV